MHPRSDNPWFDCGDAVPLTGRQPLFGEIKERLAGRWASGSALALVGPDGAGASRLLHEVRAWLRAGGRPPAIEIDGRPRGPAFASLRTGLRRRLPAGTPWALRRALRRIDPGECDRIAVLGAWLQPERFEFERACSIDPGLAADVLVRLAAQGPVLVEGLDDLDEGTAEVLRRASRPGGPVLVGTACAVPPPALGAAVRALEPLSESQVELLLRRWLRSTATARRLAGPLTAACAGWPGRVVEAVRELARAGVLRREPRGVVVARRPARWPDGCLEATAAERHAAPDVSLADAETGDEPLGVLLAEAGRLLALDDAHGARRTLLRAGTALRPADLPGRARWHRALASVAAVTGRPLASRAHRRRAAHLLLATGAVHAAARALSELGASGARGEGPQRSLAPLLRAARLHGMLSDAARRARAEEVIARLSARVRRIESSAMIRKRKAG